MRILVVAAFILSSQVFAQEIWTVQVASGISAPTDIQNAGDGSGRLFLVQQNGLIRILRNGSLVTQPFLDIRSKTRLDGERGLLGLAFPPGFAQKQRFYVDYTDLNGDTVIAQYRVTASPDIANAASEVVLLHIPQPFPNHNGGQVRFGPDGYLYIAMGDGGSGGDPMKNGQNLGALLGKLLRIDVESDPGQVRIPPGNPFVDRAGARGEIWAWGLRNPWRFSFDRATQDLWIADVGQDAYEEVDFQPAGSRGGENYGWNQMEGMHCYTAGCQTTGFVLPVAEYAHSLGCSVTGGFVYRGRASPGLRGIYLYGDYCSGRIWGLERAGAAWTSRILLSSGFGISTFGEDEAGEVYVANYSNGTVHRIEGSTAPRVRADAVVNAASFAAGMVAGSLVTVFAAGVRDDAGAAVADTVPLPTVIGGVSVTVNGIAAPIYSVSNVDGQEQVSFQAPFKSAGLPAVSVVATRNGQASTAVDVPVLAIQPAIYTSDGVQAIVVHALDNTLVTAARPLQAGEFAYFYASGLGAVAQAVPQMAAQPLDFVSWRNALHQKDAWYGTPEAVRIAENLLLYQHANGGWDKNIDMATPLGPKERATLEKEKSDRSALSTIDNSSTYTQMQYLAKVYTAVGQERYAAAFRQGFEYLLKAQYPNGGWPQFYPLRNGYWSHITYNDDAMTGVMELLRDIVRRAPEYTFLTDADRARAKSAMDRGVECILKTQVSQDGKLTVWCAQHDEKTLLPAKARAYEHPSLSGSESVGIVRFLMGIDRPPAEVVRSVQAAVAWFSANKLTGIRVVAKPAPGTPKGVDNTLVQDASAPPLWARFYELGTNRPIFSGRDSVIRYSMAEIEYERRNGYRWYVDGPAKLLNTDYPEWQAKWAPGQNVLE